MTNTGWDAGAVRAEAAPCVIVIFGASGDLTRRKLLPALFHLARQNLLPEACCVVGVARSPLTNDAFRNIARRALTGETDGADAGERAAIDRFCARLFYHAAAPTDTDALAALGRVLAQQDATFGTRGNRVFYLSLPPDTAPRAVQALHQAGLTDQTGGAWRRVIIEKPFGRDPASAHALNHQLHAALDENQIYRIDHYLGKETVQNLLALRFANSLFEPLWNSRHVSHVQITVAENIGIGSRAAYFDHAGMLRDMLQNHMLQVMSLIAMEPPGDLSPRAVRDQKTALLRSIRREQGCAAASGAVRAQYAPGWIDGARVRGYLEEDGVAPDSTTETFVAARLWVDNWRWAGVPFYLRAGKRLPLRATEASIHFRPVPQVLFNADRAAPLADNVLVIRIQPNDGISLRFSAKAPGMAFRIEPVAMDFRFAQSFGDVAPEAYERLLLDVMQGDPTLFIRADEIEASWAVAGALLDGWATCPRAALPSYEAGSWGPPEADRLIAEDGHAWRRL